jgi:flavin-binding protein dodecin
VTEPFERAERAALGRLLPARRKSNALREIEDLLARADRVREVSPEQVDEIAARYGLDLARRFSGARKTLYRRYLEHCLDDQALSPEENADLAHLRTLLRLDDAEVSEVHDEVGREVYGAAIDEVLADHRLEPEEESFLARLRKELALPERLADEAGARRSRQRFLERTTRHDHVFVAPRGRSLELSGVSTASLEDAVRRALADACSAVPELRRFDVTEISGEVTNGAVGTWHVTLKAGIDETD